MNSYLPLLKILSDGEIHSGEKLSASVGVSRAAIWKQLQKLQEVTGLKLRSVKGKGYCLASGLELLDRQLILPLLANEAAEKLYELDIRGQVDSTNTVALLWGLKNARSGYVVVAEQQLAGRGRRGRSWVSPFGCSLYCSLVWSFQAGAAALEGLSLAVGVVVARALKAIGISRIEMKWPNDILWDGRKLAGILLEMSGDAAGHCQVVIGMGINVSMTDSLSASAIDQPWTDVNSAAGIKVSRNQLLAGLLSELLPALSEFEKNGFKAFHSEWSEMDAMVGRLISVRLGEQVIVGKAAGVSTNGSLAVDTEIGRQWLHGGEVSLRLQS